MNRGRSVVSIVYLLVCVFGLTSCGQTTGNVITTSIQKILTSGLLGLFSGSLGDATASTGTCVAGGATNAFCTGGTFTSGAVDGTLNAAYAIAFDSTNGYFYVADTGNNRIAKFNTATSAFVGAIGNTTASTGTCPNSGATNAWCTGGTFASGTGDGMFNGPQSVVVDPVNGFLYVGDFGNYRVQKIVLSTGAVVGSIGWTTSSTGTCPASGAASGWCTGGIFAEELAQDGSYDPYGLALDVANDVLYVVDWLDAIHKVTLSTGAFIGSIGYTSSSTGTCPSGNITNGWCTGGVFSNFYLDGGFGFSNQSAIVLDTTHDYFYIVQDFAGRVDRYVLSTGIFAGSVGGNILASNGTCPTSGAAPGWCTGGDFQGGFTDGCFERPTSLAIDITNAYLYVGDNYKISKLNLTTGAFIGAIGKTSASTGTCPVGIVTSGWCTGGTFTTGSVDGTFTDVWGLAIEPNSGNLFGVDNHSRLIRIK